MSHRRPHTLKLMLVALAPIVRAPPASIRRQLTCPLRMAGSFCHPAGSSVADTMKVVADEVLVRERRANAVWRRRRVQPARLHAARAQPVLHRSTMDADGADVVRERGRDDSFLSLVSPKCPNYSYNEPYL